MSPGPFHSLFLLASGMRAAMADPQVRWLGGIVGALVGSATVIFKYLQGWSWVDARFFAVATISTVGYGDVVPQTTAGCLLTVFYIVLGIGVFVTAATALGNQMLRRAREIDRRSTAAGKGTESEENEP